MTDSAVVAEKLRVSRVAREAGIVVGLAGLTVLASKIYIPLPGTPVPATLQVAAVIFAGSACGPVRGLASQLLYLLIGLAGVPVFASAGMAGATVVGAPTFGYLLAFPLAAYLAGRFGGRARWLGSFAGLAVIYFLGVGWLWSWAALLGKGAGLAWALMAGFVPFLLFDVLKTALATLSATPIRRRLD